MYFIRKTVTHTAIYKCFKTENFYYYLSISSKDVGTQKA